MGQLTYSDSWAEVSLTVEKTEDRAQSIQLGVLGGKRDFQYFEYQRAIGWNYYGSNTHTGWTGIPSYR